MIIVFTLEISSPVSIMVVDTSTSMAQQKKTIEDLQRGLVDIVIGTHRILSGDVAFKDLGLLVIDEEQRFGVQHKEKIKKLKENVDGHKPHLYPGRAAGSWP